jgi:hypothetical protein
VFLKVTRKQERPRSFVTNDFIDDLSENILHVSVQMLRLVLFKPLASCFDYRLFVNRQSGSLLSMEKGHGENVN